MKKLLHILLSGIFCTLLFGCEKELDFKYKDIAPILVIEGSLTQYGAEVSLTMTTPMGELMDLTPLTDAEVTITDFTTSSTYPLSADSSGIYRGELKGETGHNYGLVVERSGERYEAQCEMRPYTEITGMEISWIKMPYDWVAALQVSFADSDPDKEEYYWLRVYRNGEPYQWATISDLLSDNGIINEVMLTTRENLDEEDESDKIEPGDEIGASVVPISKDMHTYLEALAAGNSNGPRMFSGDFCLGYFLAAPISTESIVLTSRLNSIP